MKNLETINEIKEALNDSKVDSKLSNEIISYLDKPGIMLKRKFLLLVKGSKDNLPLHYKVGNIGNKYCISCPATYIPSLVKNLDVLSINLSSNNCTSD